MRPAAPLAAPKGNITKKVAPCKRRRQGHADEVRGRACCHGTKVATMPKTLLGHSPAAERRSLRAVQALELACKARTQQETKAVLHRY